MDYLDLAKDVTARAKAKGADECDCLIEVGSTLSVTVRSGEVESIERAAFKGLGIRFFREKKLGFGFTTDLSPASLDNLLQQCADFALVSLAMISPPSRTRGIEIRLSYACIAPVSNTCLLKPRRRSGTMADRRSRASPFAGHS